jgi:regulator of RNase E activity RraA
MVEYGVPVKIGNVTICPGDIVVADPNGVVTVPNEHAEMLVEECEKMHREEQKTDKALSEGSGAAEVYRRYGRF